MKASLCLLMLFFSSLTSIFAQENLLKITDYEYLDSPQLSVFAYHSGYPVGKQGGIELIYHDKRVATNGDLKFTRKVPKDGISHHVPIPPINNPDRIALKEKATIQVPFNYKDINFKYDIDLLSGEDYLDIIVNFDKSNDYTEVEDISFQLEFFPSYYRGKSYIAGGISGIFPYRFDGSLKENEVVPLATANTIVLAPEDPELKLKVESFGQPLELIDDRWGALIGLYKIQTRFNPQKDDRIYLRITPEIIQNWERKAVIGFNQVGYHPVQDKRVVIEREKNSENNNEAHLYRFTEEGKKELVMKELPSFWGSFLRYDYYIFDISSIQQEGMYMVEYDGQESSAFRIDENIYSSYVWQPTLETFLPVQMCHMRVFDRGILWHGLCHMDDGLQAEAPLPFYDGFYQSDTTWSRFKANEHIPGINTGGWHDAGDDDVNTGSSGKTTYHLALAYEEFNITSDQTSIDFSSREAILHKSDGVEDILQQIKHGVDFLLAQYEVLNQSVVGVISPEWVIYQTAGDWGLFSDNFIYNPDFPIDSTNGVYSGVKDDRLVFTDKDTRREYLVVSILSAASRALKERWPEISEKCLITAWEIFDFEENHDPVFYRSVGTPDNLVEQRTNACVELYLTTGDEKYLDVILNSSSEVIDEIEKTAWTISRVIDKINDNNFINDYQKALQNYSLKMADNLAENPYGINYFYQVWGIGWELIWDGYKHYYLVKKYPELFPEEQIYNILHYLLGRHPGSNLTFVSGIGSHEPIPAFGLTREDYGFIPGGVYSGTNLCLPDYPELMENHPWLWQQSEYIVFGGSAWIFCVKAAEKLFDLQQSRK